MIDTIHDAGCECSRCQHAVLASQERYDRPEYPVMKGFSRTADCICCGGQGRIPIVDIAPDLSRTVMHAVRSVGDAPCPMCSTCEELPTHIAEQPGERDRIEQRVLGSPTEQLEQLAAANARIAQLVARVDHLSHGLEVTLDTLRAGDVDEALRHGQEVLLG